jgi:nucleoside phosphorylase
MRLGPSISQVRIRLPSPEPNISEPTVTLFQTISSESLEQKPDISFLVVTAVPVERDAVLGLMTPLEGRGKVLKVAWKEATYFLGRLGKYRCAIVMGEAGSDTRRGSALEVKAGIDRWQPYAVVSVGIAFGRQIESSGQEAQVLGDVLVSTQLYPYHQTKMNPGAQEERGAQPEASMVLLDRIRNSSWAWTTADDKRRRPICGPLLTGPHVINDPVALADLFARFPRAVGGEMEATGVYSASNRAFRDWIVIKAVCDWGQGKGDAAQELAARNAAGLVAAVLDEDGLDRSAFVSAASASNVPSPWQCIYFDDQADLGPALRGESLGPRHVLACPEMPEVDQIVRTIELSGAAAVVGESGSGKSMAAWHAAYRLQKSGWAIYGLSNPISPMVTPLPSRSKSLLVIDNFQALGATHLNPALLGPDVGLVVVSTDRVPGFRKSIRLLPEGDIKALAQGLRSRHDELRRVLSILDRSVGDGSFKVSVEEKIEQAARSSTRPWQFMFNLGSGHLRLSVAIKSLIASPSRGDLLFAVAARQIATMDRGADRAWLQDAALRYELFADGETADSLDQMLDEVNDLVPLVRTAEYISTPHPKVAERLVETMFRGVEAENRRTLFWDLFDDPTLQLGGLAWLVDAEPTFGALTPPELLERVVNRCRHEGAASARAHLISRILARWRLDTAALVVDLPAFRAWMEEGLPVNSFALGKLMNELLNRQISDHSKGTGGVDLAANLVAAIEPAAIAKWANAITLADGAGQAYLLNRLANGATLAWRQSVASLLDTATLATTIRGTEPENLWVAAELVAGISPYDEALARRLVRELLPAMVLGLRTSIPDGYRAAHDVFGYVLGFLPRFLGGKAPDDEQKEILGSAFNAVGKEELARQLSNSSRRDWNAWSHVAALLREGVPELAEEVGKSVQLDRLLELASNALSDSPFDVEELLRALLLSEGNEPAASLVRGVYVPRNRMSWLAACIAPDAAVSVIKAGKEFSLSLAGGLPRWSVATEILAEIQKLDATAAHRLLVANLGEVTDGLVLRQSDSVKGVDMFLATASSIAPRRVLEAVRAVDLDLARKHWPQRLAGKEAPHGEMMAVISLAIEAGGGVAIVGADLASLHEIPLKNLAGPNTKETP